MANYPKVTKDPNAVETWTIDWSPKLGSDTINTSAWVVAAGITNAADSKTTTTTTIKLSGGTAGTTYTITNTVVTVTDALTLIYSFDVAPPEPVTLQEAKDHLRVDTTDDDALIRALITAAREYAERRQRRTLLTTTKTVKYDSFPDVIRPPEPPLASVTSIAYVDEDGDSQTLSAALYDVDTDTEPGRITPAYGETWPATRGQIDAVTLTYVAGYGDAESVPELTKAGIKLILADLYENRESYVTGTIVSKVPSNADYLLAMNKIEAAH